MAAGADSDSAESLARCASPLSSRGTSQIETKKFAHEAWREGKSSPQSCPSLASDRMWLVRACRLDPLFVCGALEALGASAERPPAPSASASERAIRRAETRDRKAWSGC